MDASVPVYAAIHASSGSRFATLRQRCNVRFHRLFVDNPALIIVRQGRKLMTIDGVVLEAGAGHCVAISAGSFADVTNIPDASGVYQADVFHLAADLIGQTVPAGMTRHGTFRTNEGFETAVDAGRAALLHGADLPPSIASHRMSELLLWAETAGITLSLDASASLPIRVRRLILERPEADWRIGEIAARLAMSEPSLRRHLAGQGITATEILTDVRLSIALDLLQRTELGVAEIALRVGYDSPSRFAARFRARFGLRPSDIRGYEQRIDRISTDVDRIGVAPVSAA